MNRYQARTEEGTTAIVWDTVGNCAVRDSGGPIVWAFKDQDAAAWFAGELNKLRTVDEIRAGI
jgi:hypothetical protein